MTTAATGQVDAMRHVFEQARDAVISIDATNVVT
jgi:hypothetical protein